VGVGEMAVHQESEELFRLLAAQVLPRHRPPQCVAGIHPSIVPKEPRAYSPKRSEWVPVLMSTSFVARAGLVGNELNGAV